MPSQYWIEYYPQLIILSFCFTIEFDNDNLEKTSEPEPETNQMIKKLKEEKEELNEKLQQRSQKLDLQKMMNEMKEKAISLNLKDLKTKNNQQNQLMEILNIPEEKRNFETFQKELAALMSAHEKLKTENLKIKLQK